MAGDELGRIDEWLTATLLASSAITDIVGQRVYGELAPERSLWPNVVFQNQSAVDVIGQGPNRIMVNALYLVKGIHLAQSYAGVVRDLADAITTTLHADAGTTGDAAIFACVRQQPFRLVERDESGSQYRHAGAIFRIFCQVP